MTAYSQDCVTLVVEKLVTVADFKRQPRQKYDSAPNFFLMVFRDEMMD